MGLLLLLVELALALKPFELLFVLVWMDKIRTVGYSQRKFVKLDHANEQNRAIRGQVFGVGPGDLTWHVVHILDCRVRQLAHLPTTTKSCAHFATSFYPLQS